MKNPWNVLSFTPKYTVCTMSKFEIQKKVSFTHPSWAHSTWSVAHVGWGVSVATWSNQDEDIDLGVITLITGWHSLTTNQRPGLQLVWRIRCLYWVWQNRHNITTQLSASEWKRLIGHWDSVLVSHLLFLTYLRCIVTGHLLG